MPGTTRKPATRTRTRKPVAYDLPPDPISVPKYTLGANRVERGLQDVELPSGATCQARRPGVQGLINAGLLDSFDELTAMVQTAHIAPKKTGSIATAAKATPQSTEEAAKELMRDKEKLAAAFHLVDRLVAGIVVQPSVWVDYQGKDESDAAFAARAAKAEADGAVAVRDVDLGDKMFLVNWAIGGSADLKTFRGGLESLLGNMAAEQAVPVPAKRAPRRRG